MDKSLIKKTMSFFLGGKHAVDPLVDELGGMVPSAVETDVGTGETSVSFDTSSSLVRSLAGSVATLGDYHFPVDLIGGCCPRVLGEEQDIIWNAAAEASDTERVHVIWNARNEKVWYLAVRSSDMSSHPNTWCPFASLLPGMKDAADPPTIYTYFSDESATMMTILVDGLQIHRGTSSVVRAKAERVSRELGNAPIIELVPDRIEKLTPVPWFSLSLFEERSRRVLATAAVFSSVVFASLGIIIWLVAAMSTVSSHADLKEITERANKKSLDLLRDVQTQRASPMREQLAKFADVNDGLLSLNGYLEIYMIKNNKPAWRAVLPANVTSDRINELGGQTLDNNAQGVIVGSSRDALSLGKVK